MSDPSQAISLSSVSAEPGAARKRSHQDGTSMDQSPRMSQPKNPATTGRLASLDALRGFDMFCLLGGQQIIRALAVGAPEGSWLRGLSNQFEHADWAGFTFYD